MERPRPPRHFTDLDGMRGILACGVMFFHLGFGQILPLLTKGKILVGAWILCVDFFFILSGFVLFYSIARTKPGFPEYMAKRLRRLAPMFLLTTVAMLALRPRAHDTLTLVANFLIVQSLFELPSINMPGWSIPLELFLPAFMLVLIPPLLRAPPRLRLALLAVTLVGGAVLGIYCAQGIEYRVLRGVFGLGAGMVLGCVHQWAAPQTERPVAAIGLFLLAIALMALAPTMPVLGALFYATSAAAIYLGAQTRTFLSIAPFQALGRWSYSIYLLHIPVITLVGLFVDGRGATLPKIAIAVATIALAALCYRFVELPVMRGRRLAAPAQTAP